MDQTHDLVLASVSDQIGEEIAKGFLTQERKEALRRISHFRCRFKRVH
jgi:hypothetical protein